MTEGNPLSLILRFAILLFIGNIFQQFYNMVVGYHLGDTAIAAIGATSSLYSLIIKFAGGLNNGCSIVVTQRFGAHDEKSMKQAIALGLTTLALLFLKDPKPIFVQRQTKRTIFRFLHRLIPDSISPSPSNLICRVKKFLTNGHICS